MGILWIAYIELFSVKLRFRGGLQVRWGELNSSKQIMPDNFLLPLLQTLKKCST